MSLSCFFGHELQPDGAPFTPVMPPQSTLVITQACVTSAFPSGGPVTLYVQSHKMPSKVAVATLCPDQDVFHWPLQLIFSGDVTFYLEPALGPSGAQEASAAKPQNNNKGKGGNKAGTTTPTASNIVRPAIHISGYYECEDLVDPEDEEDSDDEDDDEFEKPSKSKKQAKKNKAPAKKRGRGE